MRHVSSRSHLDRDAAQDERKRILFSGGRRPRRDGQIVADARDFLELERGKGGMVSERVTRGRY